MAREGQHVFYRLVTPELARRLVDGFEFVEDEARQAVEIRAVVAERRELWSVPDASDPQLAAPHAVFRAM